MLSEKEIRSLISIEYEDDKGQEGQKQENEVGQEVSGQQVLDISHQELRRLKQIPLSNYNLLRVNASYNFFKQFGHLNFKEMSDQTEIPIRWLDLSFNFLKQIDSSSSACHMLKYLRYLNVSANRIESVDFKELQVPHLKTLNINNNKVKYFLHCPQSLKVLSASDNMLSALAFTGGQSLNILTAKNNLIKKVGLSLPLLVVFDIENNKLEEIDMVNQLLAGSPQLLSINLRDNPISKSRQYKITVLDKCPHIGQIDDIVISPHVRQGFKVIKAQEQLEQMLERVNKKYEMKLKEQQKIKNELVKKVKEQVRNIQEQYDKGVRNEKEQLEILEKEAKKKLARNKMGIVGEKSKFRQNYGSYAGEHEQEEKTAKKQKQQLQKQHFIEYLDFLNKRRPYSNHTPKNRIRKPKQIHSKKVIEPSQPSLQEHQSMSQMSQSALADLQGIVLFDTKAVPPLLREYLVQEIEM